MRRRRIGHQWTTSRDCDRRRRLGLSRNMTVIFVRRQPLILDQRPGPSGLRRAGSASVTASRIVRRYGTDGITQNATTRHVAVKSSTTGSWWLAYRGNGRTCRRSDACDWSTSATTWQADPTDVTVNTPTRWRPVQPSEVRRKYHCVVIPVAVQSEARKLRGFTRDVAVIVYRVKISLFAFVFVRARFPASAKFELTSVMYRWHSNIYRLTSIAETSSDGQIRLDLCFIFSFLLLANR